MSAQGPLRDREPAGFDLIETLRWEPQAGFVRSDRHLARLAASAAELGFAFDRQRVAAALTEAVHTAQTSMRMRLLLSPHGGVSATAQPFAALPADTVWRVKIARTTLRSGDRLLRHKTTRRETYAQARAEFSTGEADEVLLANERGEVCEGTITTLFADFGHGILLTPHIDCGLLAGVLRAELLDEGQARQAILPVADLGKAKALFVGNSLRELIPARLA